MSIFAPAAPAETNGSDLLDNFEAILDEHAAQAADRAEVVRARLAALEAEAADLNTLEAKIANARTTV
jgi:ElaB/YqjD/DUF883 family membrane-anchored ribosome-binding protein